MAPVYTDSLLYGLLRNREPLHFVLVRFGRNGSLFQFPENGNENFPVHRSLPDFLRVEVYQGLRFFFANSLLMIGKA